ncbi:hypothetical protein [Parvibaculum sp.]|uniref:hypothetical protein n=1 Tax=Parvibaculum sp. TaxID=2024848 RepID=UPI002B730485|nr:hypothetical protein [Parvibaculum sp.]HUD50543.1 hypothetical protein [Parvibaculum sp.]
MRGPYGALLATVTLALCEVVLPKGAEATECSWNDAISGDTHNMLFIDKTATYWRAAVAMSEGDHIEVSGAFPHARYMSLVVYDNRARTVDHITDMQVVPDTGSVNPFLAGADRTAMERRFTIRVLDQRAPGVGRSPNTLYTESADGSRSVKGTGKVPLTLRVYAPDAGMDDAGGVPLPDIAIVGSSGKKTRLTPCLGAGTASGRGGFIEGVAGRLLTFALARRFSGSGTNPPVWKKFLPDGYGENVDASYVYTTFAPEKFGPVLVVRAKAPSFAATGAGETPMKSGQLRYWSMCANLVTTAVLDCVRDEAVPVDAKGDYAIVVSRPEARPKNATSACGFAWIAAAPEDETALVYRHVIPDPSFAEAIQKSTKGAEAETMGAYYPRGSYYATVAEFESLGCAS